MAEWCKQSLMGHTSRSLEGSSMETSMDCGSPAQEVSEGSKISNWTRYHECDILAKNVDSFCPLS